MRKPNIQQVSRAGEHFVAAELHRRGAYAVTFAGNMPRIDILATNTEQTRTAAIQLKTMTARTWQTSITRGRRREEPTEEDTHFWILVELKKPPAQPEFYVVPGAREPEANPGGSCWCFAVAHFLKITSTSRCSRR